MLFKVTVFDYSNGNSVEVPSVTIVVTEESIRKLTKQKFEESLLLSLQKKRIYLKGKFGFS